MITQPIALSDSDGYSGYPSDPKNLFFKGMKEGKSPQNTLLKALDFDRILT
jgi:hypothetical protein